MEEIIKQCKAGVYLTVNKFKDFYLPIVEAIQEINERGIEQKGEEPEIPEEMAQRMIEKNCLYELQFYPHTPIGSYIVYGTSMEEVITHALEILKG